jgi:hypothetical protein
VNNKGDAAIGGNAKIIKAPKKSRKRSLFEIIVGIFTLIGTLIAIYEAFFTGK